MGSETAKSTYTSPLHTQTSPAKVTHTGSSTTIYTGPSTKKCSYWVLYKMTFTSHSANCTYFGLSICPYVHHKVFSATPL